MCLFFQKKVRHVGSIIDSFFLRVVQQKSRRPTAPPVNCFMAVLSTGYSQMRIRGAVDGRVELKDWLMDGQIATYQLMQNFFMNSALIHLANGDTV